jgi:peptidoglycan L-alanyl-D-glutamate endopeptidase CwlK
MPSFGTASQERLDTCHKYIIQVMNVVITHIDCSILEGHRSIDRQREYFRAGQSKLDPDTPEGLEAAKHCVSPSEAVDVLPYPIDWEDHKRIAFFAGFTVAIGRTLDIPLRSGVNWSRDLSTLNSTGSFFDGPHIELMLD